MVMRARLNSVKCYVINLDRAPERLAHMDREFRLVGMEYERLPAIDGTRLHEVERSAVVAPALRTRDWSPGEAGCLLSHHEAWSRIAAGTDEFGAIFEDDIVFDEKVASLLCFIENRRPRGDIIKLETNLMLAELDRRPSVVSPPSNLHRLRSLHSGTGAYVLSRRAAQDLIGRLSLFDLPVDDVLFGPHAASNDLLVLQALPAVALQISVGSKPPAGSVFSSGIESERGRVAKEAFERRMATRRPVEVVRYSLYAAARWAFLIGRRAIFAPFRIFGPVPAPAALIRRAGDPSGSNP